MEYIAVSTSKEKGQPIMRKVIICSEEENAKVFKKRKTLNAAFSEPKMAFPGCVVTPSTVFFVLPNSAWRIDSCLEGRGGNQGAYY